MNRTNTQRNNTRTKSVKKINDQSKVHLANINAKKYAKKVNAIANAVAVSMIWIAVAIMGVFTNSTNEAAQAAAITTVAMLLINKIGE